MVLRIVDEDGSVRILIRAQPRDWHGRFASGGGGPANNSGPDDYGNTREDGQWFDADGIYMTDSYVEKYGLPVTHSGFEEDASGRYSVVLSETGKIHIMREHDGGPSDALYTRDAGDVRIEGMDARGARSLSKDVLATSDTTLVGRPMNEAGEDIGGPNFGVGKSRTNEATGVTLTSAPEGAVVVSGLGKGGKAVTVQDVGQFSDSLNAMADAADELR